MSFILNRVQIGQQGVLPGELLMQSTDDLDTITSPGYLTTADGVLPSDIITCAYGPDFSLKQVFNPVFSGTEITLSIIGGGGSINGATNLGGGDGLLGVSGDNITGLSLIAGANITLTPTATDITIAATGSGGGTITGLADVGTGQGHISAGNAGSLAQVKTINAGSNVVVTEDSTSITIASTASNNGLTTLANLPGGEGIYASTVGTTAQLKSIAAGAGIDVSASGNNVIITNVGGGGGNFEYENTYWLAQNGNDANDGLSINTPKLTLLGVETLLTTTPTVINIVDGGTYSLPSTFTVSCPLLINAPGATIQWTGAASGIMFFQNTFSPLIANIGEILAGNSLYVFASFSPCYLSGPTGFCQVQTTGRLWDDRYVFAPGVSQAVFNINTDRTGCIFQAGNTQNLIINAIDLGGSSISCSIPSGSGYSPVTVNAEFWNGRISGTADYDINVSYLGGGFSSSTSGIINFNVGKSDLDVTTLSYNGLVKYNPTNLNYPNNIFNNPLYLFQQPVIGELYEIIYEAPSSGSWSFLPGVQNGNTQISIQQNASSGSITLPAGSSVPYGWRMTFQQTVAGGANLIIYPGSNDTINGQNSVGPDATSCYTGIGIGEFARGAANGSGGYDWAVSNCYTTNLSSLSNAIYFSQSTGSDTLGNGTYPSPLATIGASTTLAASYPGTTLVGLDSSTYAENVSITTNFNIQAPDIIIAPTTGDAITFGSGSAPTPIINVGRIAPVAGNAITIPGGPTIDPRIIAEDIIGGGSSLAVLNSQGGNVFIWSDSITGNTLNTGGGNIYYTTQIRSGTDDGSTFGSSAVGTQGPWTIGGALAASGLNYPTADAASGAVVTTDGSGNLSLQPAPTPFYFSSNPVAFSSATITLDATFLGYRIIENNAAGPCTWTMDTGINLTSGLPAAVSGSSFNVFVSNGTGATITLVSNTNATVHGSPCSQTNFTISLKYTASNTWDIFY